MRRVHASPIDHVAHLAQHDVPRQCATASGTRQKVKARSSVDLVVVAVTTVLSRLVARRLWPLLTATGETWQRTVVWGTSETVTVRVVEPLVAEVSADVAVDDGGVFRHPVRLLRVRPDLAPEDLAD